MTLITPEMQKKQEEAMDKFLAKDKSSRYKEVRTVCKRYFRSSATEVFCRQTLQSTYIPLAKYHAMTYKEQEERDKVRLSTSFKREKINCWNSLENKYVEVDRICLSGPKEAPFVKRLTGSAGNYPNQILCDFWLPGFDYLESSGYYLAPEGWQPPPQWDVVDQREKKKD